MVTQLKELITSMEQMGDHFFDLESRQRKKEITSILEKIAQKNPKKDDNTLASYVITIITIVPGIMQHPNNQAFAEFCQKLKPSELYLIASIHEKFFAKPQQPEPRKPRL